jgi:DNA-binding transcriptional LysR family regulator
MNFNVLRYFVTVYEERSMTRAAKKLFVSQSSLSQCIRQLEKDLGASLFERSRTLLKPTRSGEYYVYWAKQTLASEQKMRQNIIDLTQSPKRKLVIGISNQVSRHYLKYVMPKFCKQADNCMVILKEHSSQELYSLLQRGSIEFIIDYPHPEWTLYKGILILNEKMIVVAPVSMRFQVINSSGKLPSISINELAGKPFISLSGNERYTEFMNNVFSRIGCSPQIVMECANPEIAYDMVSAQIGMTIHSEIRFQLYKRPDVCYYSISDYPLVRPTSVTFKKDRLLSDDAQLFISILQEECGKLSS